jgi:N-acetylmuramoyl-L-alanine amidase
MDRPSANNELKPQTGTQLAQATPGGTTPGAAPAGNTKVEQKREERAKAENISDGLKFVIDGAKLQCVLCTAPIGTMKVNLDTPTIQNKRTATVAEKSSASLQFSGNCIKSPKSALPCKAVMKLGEWKDTGTGKVQNKSPLLKRSTIPCTYGGATVRITDDGQRQEPGQAAPGAPVPEIKTGTVIDAYFAIEGKANYERITWAGVDEKVCIVVRTIGLAGKQIDVNIIDRDGILYDAKNSPIEVLQDDTDKKVRLTTTVYDDGLAIIPITLRPAVEDKEDKPTKAWREKIGNSKDKKAYLSLLVDAHTKNSDFKITYNGANPKGGDSFGTEDKTNYFLDMRDKWFELKRKMPVIVIDPGHGYTKGNTGAVSFIYTHKLKGPDGQPLLDANKKPQTAVNNVMALPQYVIDAPDTWVLSKKEDPDRSERFLVHDVGAQLMSLLEKKGYRKNFITRVRGPIAGNDDSSTRQARLDIANNNKADYFISIHADGLDSLTATGSHVIYSGTADTKSQELAVDIFSSYNVVTVEANSPKTDVRGLQVLSGSNKTERKVLVELGFVTSPADAKKLFGGVNTIASQLEAGLIVNMNKNF